MRNTNRNVPPGIMCSEGKESLCHFHTCARHCKQNVKSHSRTTQIPVLKDEIFRNLYFSLFCLWGFPFSCYIPHTKLTVEHSYPLLYIAPQNPVTLSLLSTPYHHFHLVSRKLLTFISHGQTLTVYMK